VSKLDNLYTYLRRYCKEIANHRRNAIMTYLVIYDDGSGRVESKRFAGNEHNPFEIIIEEIIRFDSPAEGASLLKGLLDDSTLRQFFKSSGRTDSGNLEKI
jgi:hypothetical protein